MVSTIIISGGDPTGISPEILEKSVQSIADADRSVIYFCNAGPGHIQTLSKGLKVAGMNVRTGKDPIIPGLTSEPLFQIVDIGTATAHSDSPIPGKPDSRSGSLSFLALRLAVDFIENHGCDGLITLPLSKEWVIRSGEKDFSGHTGYLARRSGREVVMLMHGVEFSVIPITEHIPIAKVPAELRKRLENIDFLSRLLDIHNLGNYSGGQRWALCALNPHAGEGGLIGSEEIDFMNSIADRWRASGLPVDGPLPADGVFLSDIRKRYRLILCPYHDQALIPFKSLEGERGVNATIGLPYLRVSPDHGTAYGIAGQGIANPTSFQRCLESIIKKELVTIAKG